MISLTRSLEHMAWSNQEIIKEISKFPEVVYALRAAEGEWPVGRILYHFLIGSGEWYRYILAGAKWSEVKKINSAEILLEIADYIKELDSFLIEQSNLEDERIKFETDSGSEETSRSLVLSQAVMHAAEHKGQLATILKAHGYFLDLDKYDHWAFENIKK